MFAAASAVLWLFAEATVSYTGDHSAPLGVEEAEVLAKARSEENRAFLGGRSQSCHRPVMPVGTSLLVAAEVPEHVPVVLPWFCGSCHARPVMGAGQAEAGGGGVGLRSFLHNSSTATGQRKTTRKRSKTS